jgi:hypothetical protein
LEYTLATITDIGDPPTVVAMADIAGMEVPQFFTAGSSDRGTGVLGLLVTRRYRGFPQSQL